MAKALFWLGFGVFVLLTILALLLAHTPWLSAVIFWQLLLAGIAVLAGGVVGMSIFFLRQRVLPLPEHRLPKKYFALLILLLGLLGLGLMLT